MLLDVLHRFLFVSKFTQKAFFIFQNILQDEKFLTKNQIFQGISWIFAQNSYDFD